MDRHPFSTKDCRFHTLFCNFPALSRLRTHLTLFITFVKLIKFDIDNCNFNVGNNMSIKLYLDSNLSVTNSGL